MAESKLVLTHLRSDDRVLAEEADQVGLTEYGYYRIELEGDHSFLPEIKTRLGSIIEKFYRISYGKTPQRIEIDYVDDE